MSTTCAKSSGYTGGWLIECPSAANWPSPTNMIQQVLCKRLDQAWCDKKTSTQVDPYSGLASLRESKPGGTTRPAQAFQAPRREIKGLVGGFSGVADSCGARSKIPAGRLSRKSAVAWPASEQHAAHPRHSIHRVHHNIGGSARRRMLVLWPSCSSCSRCRSAPRYAPWSTRPTPSAGCQSDQAFGAVLAPPKTHTRPDRCCAVRRNLRPGLLTPRHAAWLSATAVLPETPADHWLLLPRASRTALHISTLS